MSEPVPRHAGGGEADSLRAIFEHWPSALVAFPVGAGLLAALYADALGRASVQVLLLALVALLPLRALHARRYLRQRGVDDHTVLAWRTSWRALVLAQGLWLGAAGWLLGGLGTPLQLAGLNIVLFGFCLGSAYVMATQRGIFTVFVVVALGPLVVRAAVDANAHGTAMLAGIGLAQISLAIVAGRDQGNALAQAMRLKAHADDLARRLRAETALADAARRAAEAANLAKAQFLAAASHDLRQPLHALALFAEALRQRSRDPEIEPLVTSVKDSVGVLEALFAELLDLSRLDAGRVGVHAAPLPLARVYARVRATAEVAAFEKGLVLSFHGGRHVAFADEVIVERILHNLVANAIRYTDDGGVVVGCRRRSGRLLLQVWDSGVGIEATHLPHIWDEFYQVRAAPVTAAPGARRGMGLGLAIVKRLAALIDAPLEVRSRPGHGSVFSVELPQAAAGAAAATAPGERRAEMPAVTLHGRRFVVVDDEPAACQALAALLAGWGAQVQAFDSAAQVRDWIAASPGACPDLALVDLQLDGGADGFDLLAALRAAWPSERLPAIVVTGSTAAQHEQRARAVDAHLLVKPVLPHKLRSLVSYKLGSPGAAAAVQDGR